MKQLLFFLLCFGLASSIAVAQDPSSIITIDLDENGQFFADVGTIPHGQKIQLKGKEGNNVFQKIEVEVATFNGKQNFIATINDTDWKIEIGPFQPRQLITLTVKALRKTGNNSKIGKLFSEGLSNTIPVINAEFDKRGGIRPDSLKGLFFITLQSKLGNSVDNYFISDERKVIDNLSMVIDTNCLFANLNCLGRNLLSILSNRYNSKMVIAKNDSLKSKIESNIIDLKIKLISIVDSLNKRKTTPINTVIDQQIATIKAAFIIDSTMMKARIDSILLIRNARIVQRDKAEKDLGNFLIDITSKIKFNLITTTLPVSSVDLRASGVEYYAGFDVSTIAFDKELGATGLYFTVSPYLFGKFDPELDFSDVRKKLPRKEDPLRCKVMLQNFASFIKYHISPTVGIAFSGNADVPSTPQIFVGGSLRINRLFKITMGSVFYRDVNMYTVTSAKKYIHNFGIGMSLNISYLGTVMQMLGNATRSIKTP